MLGIGCKLLGHVMVEPNDPETTLQRCRERLAEGACVHFYPEGTRSPTVSCNASIAARSSWRWN